uniref:Uncharacterized protein n=1 Tax=Utricularia reniformis TaxID=192314 RepID=A0A1Y0B350_9LAMI|nr:hypothetical protein AEK19_MT1648 [Utricularia reniformis]ART31831.1 hypothetical protein AEK19_MT1648 [Utricularia reniformis]
MPSFHPPFMIKSLLGPAYAPFFCYKISNLKNISGQMPAQKSKE